MAKSARRNPNNVVTMPIGETAGEPNRQVAWNEDAIARRAYELYCARGREDGHDLDDWLSAERELRADAGSTAA